MKLEEPVAQGPGGRKALATSKLRCIARARSRWCAGNRKAPDAECSVPGPATPARQGSEGYLKTTEPSLGRPDRRNRSKVLYSTRLGIPSRKNKVNSIQGFITDFISEDFSITSQKFTIGIVATGVTLLNLVAVTEDFPRSFMDA